MNDDFRYTNEEDFELDGYDYASEGESWDDEDAFDAEEDGFDYYSDANEFDEFGGDNVDELEFMDGIDEWGWLKKRWKGIKKLSKIVAPLAKKLAPWAGKAIGMALGGPGGAAIGGKLGGFVANLEDDEYDGFDHEDSEDEMRAEYDFPPDSVDEETAEYLNGMAARAKKPSDAGALASAAAATMASKSPPKVKAVVPVIAAASANVAKVMTKAPQAATLKKTIGSIQRKTIATLNKKAAKGKPVNATVAKRVMQKHAYTVLGSPKQIAKAIAKNETKRRALNKKAVMGAERFDSEF